MAAGTASRGTYRGRTLRVRVIKCLVFTARPIELIMWRPDCENHSTCCNRINFPADVKSRENADSWRLSCLRLTRDGGAHYRAGLHIVGISCRAADNERGAVVGFMKGSYSSESMETAERLEITLACRHPLPKTPNSLEWKYAVPSVYPRREKNAIYVNLNFYQNPVSVYTGRGVNRVRFR